MRWVKKVSEVPVLAHQVIWTRGNVHVILTQELSHLRLKRTLVKWYIDGVSGRLDGPAWYSFFTKTTEHDKLVSLKSPELIDKSWSSPRDVAWIVDGVPIRYRKRVLDYPEFPKIDKNWIKRQIKKEPARIPEFIRVAKVLKVVGLDGIIANYTTIESALALACEV